MRTEARETDDWNEYSAWLWVNWFYQRSKSAAIVSVRLSVFIDKQSKLHENRSIWVQSNASKWKGKCGKFNPIGMCMQIIPYNGFDSNVYTYSGTSLIDFADPKPFPIPFYSSSHIGSQRIASCISCPVEFHSICVYLYCYLCMGFLSSEYAIKSSEITSQPMCYNE